MLDNTVSKKVMIPVVAAVVIIGALIRKEFSTVGHWVTVAAVGFYVLAYFRGTWHEIRHVKQAGAMQRVGLFVSAALFITVLSAIFTSEVNYFATLVLLAADYLLTDKKEQN